MNNNNIKLSRIELEAFRGYRDKVSFDFRLPEKKIANIIAIYAPNGFGKTSFFDGVEWSTKGSIERFDENTKIKNAAKEFGGSILKNRESELLYGTVSLFDSNELYFSRQTSTSENWDLLAGRIDRTSASPLKNIGEYKDFKKIEILPQSRIDSFLSSNTPEEKYQALLDFWDGNDESDYFVGVSKFHEENDKEKEKIRGEINGLADKIAKLTTSESKIDFFNSLAKEINGSKNNNSLIPEFAEQISDAEFETIIRTINVNAASVSSKLQQAESRQALLIALEEGFALYIKNNESLLILTGEVKDLQSSLNNFQQLQNKQVEQDELKMKLQKAEVDLEEIKVISSSKETFSTIVDQIEELLKEQNTIATEKPSLVQQKNSTENDLKIKADRLKNLLDSEIKYNENFERLEDLFNTIEANKKRSESSNNRLSLSKRIKETRSSLASAIRSEINTVQSMLSLTLESFCNGEYTYDIFKELASEIKQEFKEVNALKNTLKELRSDYNKKGNLNENLQKIIEFGRDFITQTQTSTCPLCNTPQDDFEKLLSRISIQKDDVLNLNQSFDTIQSLELDISKRTNGLDEKYESLLKKLRQTVSELTDNLTAINLKILKTEALINYYSGVEMVVESENKRLNEQYNAIESENGLLKLQLEDLDSLKESISRSIMETEKKLEDLKGKITGSDHRVEEIVAGIGLIHQDPQYIKVSTFLEKKTIQQSEYLESGLDKQIRDTDENVQNLRGQVALLQSQIGNLTESIAGKYKDDIQKDLTEKTNTLNDIEGKIAQYKSQYKSITERDDLTIEIVRANLSDNRNINQDLKNLDVKLRELQANIQVMQQNIELNKLKNEREKKQKQLKALEESGEKLGMLKKELSDFLTQKINSVLNQEIINDIYKKIDPHPDFKTIKLVPQFDGIKPRLFIKAVNEESNDEIDPILYLSSAQVNILSLSIFLAKALQNKDVMVNTIFMDDPIQYLDSINVLSFIDLLRSITADKQLDRQVVISTHDENFFNLLKKKFDPEYYDAKFIEFESYGKLKIN